MENCKVPENGQVRGGIILWFRGSILHCLQRKVSVKTGK
jgi:hypothetical protein